VEEGLTTILRARKLPLLFAAFAVVFLLVLALSLSAAAAQVGAGGSAAVSEGAPSPEEAQQQALAKARMRLLEFIPPTEIEASDLPNDDGKAVVITWRKSPSSDAEGEVRYTVYFAEGATGTFGELPFYFRPIKTVENVMADNLQYWRYSRKHRDYQYIIIDLTAFDAAAEEAFEREEKAYAKRLEQGLPVGPEPALYEYDWDNFYFKFGIVSDGEVRLFEPPLHAEPKQSWFDTSKWNNLLMALAFLAAILILIEMARRLGLYLRRIAGLDAVDEAIGRATELGRPIFYLCGLDPMTTVSTIASVNLLGHVARHVANYESQVKVPCFDPIVMSVADETVREAYLDAGRPDAYNPDNIFFLTNDQFSYVAAVNGMMVRERPAANFFFGYFYAESLLLGEVGQSTGAIQIAGTDANVQIPFFITSCDYTLIGEELYAASAYISREPKLLGSIKASDIAKAVIIIVLLVGLAFSVALLIGTRANPDAPLGGVGEVIEYLMQVFNQHA